MKYKHTFMVAMLLIIATTATAQKGKRTDPDRATYSIIGTMQVNDGKRILSDAHGKNIQFEYVGNRLARPTEKADLMVRFDKVTTTHPGGVTRLNFWRYDEEVGEWIYDSEVRQGEQELESTMKTNIMLVIDNSKSLAGDFKKVQDAAIEFVGQLYRESQGRNFFRVGIIGFSTIQFTRIREITTLDAENYRQIVSFIRGLEMQNGTALYYSLEKALEMLEDDAARNIMADEYKESRIYAFTDGLDQASVDDSRGLSTPTQYYDHLRPMMKGSQRKNIMGMSNKVVYSTLVTVRGGDMTDKQETLFDKRAEEICDNVSKLRDMSELVAEFKKLASDLVNSNYVLYCYIPVGASGRVGWTFAEKKVKMPRFWLGVGIEGGRAGDYDYLHYERVDYPAGSRASDYDYVDWVDTYFAGVHLDAAWPIGGSKFALGASISIDFIPYNSSCLGGGIGPLVKYTFSNNSSILFGAGLKVLANYGDDVLRSYMSLGWKFKSPWYINAFVTTGGESIDWGIGIGYSLRGGK